jgi:hypothetical protein
MSKHTPEDLVRETLRAKAGEATVDLGFEEIRRSADTHRRRTGRRTALLAAAAVVVAVGAPTAFLLRPNDAAPSPAPQPTNSPAPSAAPTRTQTPSTPSTPPTSALAAIRKGTAPGITYLHDGTVHFGSGGTARLPDPTAPVTDFTTYHGGWLVGVGAGADRVRWYDNTGTMRSDGPGTGIFAVSEDGTQTAYAQDGAIHIGISSGMGEGEQTIPVQAGRFWPVGFLRGDKLVHQAGNKVVVDGATLPGMAIARAVSAEAGLVAGEEEDGHTLVMSPSGHVVWSSADWAVWGFSPDGRYAAATNSPSGGEISSLAILDARTGEVIAQHDVLRDGISLGGHPVMDDDGSVLIAATDGNTLEQTVLRLDRDGVLTRATDVFSMDPASDASYVVFATRP